MPAWLGPETLTSDWFLGAIRDAGVTTLRLPGGSWSNSYDWAGCEAADPDRCYWLWAARPSDFVQLLADTGLAGIWTQSINHTPQSAAAAVAFFNGSVDDDHVIGLDRDGVDWGTTGDWAALRTDNGHPQPANIKLWEIGNEVYGGKPDVGGDQCASFGWEDVWTCDGAEYVTGNDQHDGYLAIRAAMLDVDPTIEVGAVGVADPESWSDWGNEVVTGAGAALDFYVVHQYGFDQSPSVDETFKRSGSLWPSLISDARTGLPDGVELAITEYNLVSFEAADTEQTMTRAMNALFVADTIGQFAIEGVEIANQWNMANGTTGSGTDYGLVSATDGARFPQFHAVALWGRTGDELLDVATGVDSIHVYPTRRIDGSLAILIINFSDDRLDIDVQLNGVTDPNGATIESYAAAPRATTLEVTGPTAVAVVDAALQVDLPGVSISIIEVPAGG